VRDYSSECEIVLKNLPADFIKRLEGKSIFLTGAAGFIGKWFIRFFEHLNDQVLEVPCRILCVEHHSPIRQTEFIKSIKLDLKNPIIDIDCKEWKFDFIIHAAGISNPQEYSRLPLETLDLSYLGTKNVLEFSRQHNIESILCFSSAAIYGNVPLDSIPIKEEHVGTLSPFSDRSSYTIGKQVLETLCHIYYNKFASPIKIVRPFNIYGPDMNNGVVLAFIDKVLSRQVITIYGDGQQTRTFCGIVAALEGFLRILLNGVDGEAYNIGSENSEISMFELATMISSFPVRENKIEIKEYPKGYPSSEPRRSCPDMTKARQQLGFLDSTVLKDGLSVLFEERKKDTRHHA